jgi:hypothetical protein
MAAANAPSARWGHAAVWTGQEMLVWGGTALVDSGGGFVVLKNLDDGALYEPRSDSWAALPMAGAPLARDGATGVWTGAAVVVWGGEHWEPPSPDHPRGVFSNLQTGSLYDPARDAWLTVATEGAPSVRTRHSAVWTATAMLVWGGTDNDSDGIAIYPTGTGAAYRP